MIKRVTWSNFFVEDILSFIQSLGHFCAPLPFCVFFLFTNTSVTFLWRTVRGLLGSSPQHRGCIIPGNLHLQAGARNWLVPSTTPFLQVGWTLGHKRSSWPPLLYGWDFTSITPFPAHSFIPFFIPLLVSPSTFPSITPICLNCYRKVCFKGIWPKTVIKGYSDHEDRPR